MSLPIILASADPEDSLEAYVQTYLREEVKAEALVRSLPGFARFLPVAATLHGRILNVSGVARESSVGRTTVSGYLDILEDTLLAYRLAGYKARLRVRERRLPKLYIADCGVARALRRSRGPLQPDERGPLFEGWIGSVLRAYRDYRRLFDEFAYWAPVDARDTEVDFLLRRGTELLAVEARATRSPGRDHLRGLRAVSALSGLTRRILVHLGERDERTVEGIDVLTAGTFCAQLATGAIWSAGVSG